MQFPRSNILAFWGPMLILHGGLSVSVAQAQKATTTKATTTKAAPTARAPSVASPRVGSILLRPSLLQLRPLVGRVVRITLNDGKRHRVKLLSVWPGVVRVSFADGSASAYARHRIRSVTYLGPRFLSPATRSSADSGKIFAHLGLGLTIGAVVLGGALAPPLYVLGSNYQCPGILDCVPPATTAAILVTTLSASALIAGVPLWIAGVVRQKVHGREGPAAARARRRFRAWGMGLTFTGAGLTAVGSALLGVSASAGVSANQSQTTLRWAGGVTASLGVFVALCIGLPMWVEAVRKGPSTEASTNRATSPRTLWDPHHQDSWSAHHRPTPLTATFAYGWRF